MSMLSLTGEVMNVLLTPKGTNREGKEYGGYHQVQLLCEEPLTNGETRMSLFTLATDAPQAFAALRSRRVRVPVGVFARSNALHFYLQRGGRVEEVSE